MKKDLQKCDSLKVAYFEINRTLDSLINANNQMFKDFDHERSQKIQYQEQLQKKETEFKKLFQKPNTGWIVPVLIGITGGVVLGVSL